ncbi:hypothetical protein PTTG_30393, partial [Puccinia triticina 1-1 BBBD Race 1]
KTIKGPSLHHLILSLSSLSDLDLYPVALTSKSSASTARPPLLNHHNHQHSRPQSINSIPTIPFLFSLLSIPILTTHPIQPLSPLARLSIIISTVDSSRAYSLVGTHQLASSNLCLLFLLV